jgi:flavodoxin
MKALVVYDSYFGNTKKVARAIGAALGLADGDVVKVTDVKPSDITGLDWLIVGSPTRAFQASDGIKSFLKNLPAGILKGIKVAAFDTRIVIGDQTPGILKVLVKIFGYAAEPIGRKLVRKGGTQVLAPAGFFVMESEGPLKDGELLRAADWVQSVR